MKEITILKKYRDLEIDKDEIMDFLNNESLKNNLQIQTEINIENILKIINYIATERIDAKNLLEWINVVTHSGLFRFKNDEGSCIMSVLKELEKSDTNTCKISDINLERYLNSLRNNKELN